MICNLFTVIEHLRVNYHHSIRFSLAAWNRSSSYISCGYRSGNRRSCTANRTLWFFLFFHHFFIFIAFIFVFIMIDELIFQLTEHSHTFILLGLSAVHSCSKNSGTNAHHIGAFLNCNFKIMAHSHGQDMNLSFREFFL